MKAWIGLDWLAYSKSLCGYFMRHRSCVAFDELMSFARDDNEVFKALEEMYDNIEDLERDLYSFSTEDMIDCIGKDLFDYGKCM